MRRSRWALWGLSAIGLVLGLIPAAPALAGSAGAGSGHGAGCGSTGAVTTLNGSQLNALLGAANVLRLTLSPSEAQRLEQFVWNTLTSRGGAVSALAPGPYDGSFYYESARSYSGLYTCNTWTTQALHEAGLPIHSFGVEFSGQVWRQVRRLAGEQHAMPAALP